MYDPSFFLKKKIIITGGAGFIGSCLARKLVELGAEVTIVDDLSRGSLDNLSFIKEKIKIVETDLRFVREIGFFHDSEMVFNLAALNTGVDYDQGRTHLMFEDNLLLQMNPLKLASQVKTIHKFIQISSASVYSTQAMEKQIPTPETADTCHPEESKLGYALAKKMGENLAQWYAENTFLETVSVRFINVYGERDNYDSKGHFIPVMIRKFIEADQVVEIFGSGSQKRSFLYVEDAVNALLVLAEKGKSWDVYNVDSENELSVKEVVEQIKTYFSKKQLQLFYNTKMPEGSKRRMLDSSKIQSLGWKSQVSFEKGLERTVKDVRNRLSKKI